jgi:uncharacterized protein YceK
VAEPPPVARYLLNNVNPPAKKEGAMHWIKRRIVILSLMAVVAVGPLVVPASRVAAGYATHESRSGFNDEYVFAATRSLNHMEGVDPALKVTLFPVTIVLDTVFLPFAVIAGFVS